MVEHDNIGSSKTTDSQQRFARPQSFAPYPVAGLVTSTALGLTTVKACDLDRH
jgi:hypothetical protein